MTTVPKELRQLGLGTPVEDYWREKEKYEKAFIDYYVIRLNKSYFNKCFNFNLKLVNRNTSLLSFHFNKFDRLNYLF